MPPSTQVVQIRSSLEQPSLLDDLSLFPKSAIATTAIPCFRIPVFKTISRCVFVLAASACVSHTHNHHYYNNHDKLEPLSNKEIAFISLIDSTTTVSLSAVSAIHVLTIVILAFSLLAHYTLTSQRQQQQQQQHSLGVVRQAVTSLLIDVHIYTLASYTIALSFPPSFIPSHHITTTHSNAPNLTTTPPIMLPIRFVQMAISCPSLVLANFVVCGHGPSSEAALYMLLSFVSTCSGIYGALLLDQPPPHHTPGVILLVTSFLAFVFVLYRSYEMLPPLLPPQQQQSQQQQQQQQQLQLQHQQQQQMAGSNNSIDNRNYSNHHELIFAVKSITWRLLQIWGLLSWSFIPSICALLHHTRMFHFLLPTPSSFVMSEAVFCTVDVSTKIIHTCLIFSSFSSQITSTATTVASTKNIVSLSVPQRPLDDRQDTAVPCANETSSIASFLSNATRSLKTASWISPKVSAQRAFLSCITHDMRTPLNIMISHNMSLLESGAVVGEHRKRVEESLSAAECLLWQIDLALEYSRYEQQGIQLKVEQVDLIEILDSIVEANVYRASAKKIEFQTLYPQLESSNDNSNNIYFNSNNSTTTTATTVTVDSDGYHLQSIIGILLDNAIKFAHEESSVFVQVALDTNAGDVCIYVHNGRSELIDMRKRDRMFQAFEVCTLPQRQDVFSGIGLGLAVLESKVRALHGRIEVDISKPDRFKQLNSAWPAQALDVVIRLPMSARDRTKHSPFTSANYHSNQQQQNTTTTTPADFQNFYFNNNSNNNNNNNNNKPSATTPTRQHHHHHHLVVVAALVVGLGVRHDIAHSVLPIAAKRVGVRVYGEGVVPAEKIVIFAEPSRASADCRLQDTLAWARSTGRVVRVVVVRGTVSVRGLVNQLRANVSPASESSSLAPTTMFATTTSLSATTTAALAATPSVLLSSTAATTTIASNAANSGNYYADYYQTASNSNNNSSSSNNNNTLRIPSQNFNNNNSILMDLVGNNRLQPSSSTASASGIQESSSTTTTTQGMRVLCVDDNSMNLKILCKVLKDLGCETVCAENGLEAVNIASQTIFSANRSSISDFDCVIMDLRMPVMDGFEAVRKIRELEQQQQQRLYIVALTANSSAEDRNEAMASGCDEFMTKPVRKPAVLASLQTARNRK